MSESLKRCRGYGPALYVFGDYSAVIPHIQNVYGPEQEKPGCGWSFGFKYTSGVFEFFTVATQGEAAKEVASLSEAIDAYWRESAERPSTATDEGDAP